MTEQPPTSPPPEPQQAPPSPTPAGYPPPWWVRPPRRSFLARFFRVLIVLLFVLSVLLNIEMALLLVAERSGSMSSTRLVDGKDDQIVAVYQVTGMIDGKAAGDFGMFYRMVRDNKDIKAVVVRINSGGGGVSSSDQIQETVKAIRETLGKPVVVSMGGVAASGGYYIAAPADEIYAEPTTITGSIGVIVAWPVAKELMKKIGVEPIIIRSTHSEDWKAKENFFEAPDEKTLANLKAMLDSMQERFEQVVKDGRGEKVDPDKMPAVVRAKLEKNEPFNGKVYTADEAKALGLVDEIGYLGNATAAAAKFAGLSEPRVVQYTRRPGLLTTLLATAEAQRIDAKLLDDLTSPRFLMLWRP